VTERLWGELEHRQSNRSARKTLSLVHDSIFRCSLCLSLASFLFTGRLPVSSVLVLLGKIECLNCQWELLTR